MDLDRTAGTRGVETGEYTLRTVGVTVLGRFPSEIRIVYNFKKSTAVAFEAFDIGNGREAIIVTSGRTCHIVRHEDGTWSVDEDEHHRAFPQREDALDCAREIAGDPDLPPLTQV